MQALGEALQELEATSATVQSVQGLQSSLDSHAEAVHRLRGVVQEQAVAPDSQAAARWGSKWGMQDCLQPGVLVCRLLLVWLLFLPSAVPGTPCVKSIALESRCGLLADTLDTGTAEDTSTWWSCC